MTDAELEHLLQMLADIERNLAFNDDAEQRIAEHLERFWAPRMRERLLAHGQADPDAISPLSRKALERLRLAAP